MALNFYLSSDESDFYEDILNSEGSTSKNQSFTRSSDSVLDNVKISDLAGNKNFSKFLISDFVGNEQYSATNTINGIHLSKFETKVNCSAQISGRESESTGSKSNSSKSSSEFETTSEESSGSNDLRPDDDSRISDLVGLAKRIPTDNESSYSELYMSSHGSEQGDIKRPSEHNETEKLINHSLKTLHNTKEEYEIHKTCTLVECTTCKECKAEDEVKSRIPELLEGNLNEKYLQLTKENMNDTNSQVNGESDIQDDLQESNSIDLVYIRDTSGCDMNLEKSENKEFEISPCDNFENVGVLFTSDLAGEDRPSNTRIQNIALPSDNNESFCNTSIEEVNNSYTRDIIVLPTREVSSLVQSNPEFEMNLICSKMEQDKCISMLKANDNQDDVTGDSQSRIYDESVVGRAQKRPIRNYNGNESIDSLDDNIYNQILDISNNSAHSEIKETTNECNIDGVNQVVIVDNISQSKKCDSSNGVIGFKSYIDVMPQLDIKVYPMGSSDSGCTPFVAKLSTNHPINSETVSTKSHFENETHKLITGKNRDNKETSCCEAMVQDKPFLPISGNSSSSTTSFSLNEGKSSSENIMSQILDSLSKDNGDNYNLSTSVSRSSLTNSVNKNGQNESFNNIYNETTYDKLSSIVILDEVKEKEETKSKKSHEVNDLYDQINGISSTTSEYKSSCRSLNEDSEGFAIIESLQFCSSDDLLDILEESEERTNIDSDKLLSLSSTSVSEFQGNGESNDSGSAYTDIQNDDSEGVDEDKKRQSLIERLQNLRKELDELSKQLAEEKERNNEEAAQLAEERKKVVEANQRALARKQFVFPFLSYDTSALGWSSAELAWEQIRAKRMVAAMEFKATLVEVEAECSAELSNLENVMEKLEPLNRIASCWAPRSDYLDACLSSSWMRRDFFMEVTRSMNVSAVDKELQPSRVNDHEIIIS